MTKREQLAKYIPNQGNDPLDKECGKRITELVKKRSLKSKDAAAMLGWSASKFYTYASGRKRLRINCFAQLVDRLSQNQQEVAYLLEVYWEEDDD